MTTILRSHKQITTRQNNKTDTHLHTRKETGLLLTQVTQNMKNAQNEEKDSKIGTYKPTGARLQCIKPEPEKGKRKFSDKR